MLGRTLYSRTSKETQLAVEISAVLATKGAGEAWARTGDAARARELTSMLRRLQTFKV